MGDVVNLKKKRREKAVSKRTGLPHVKRVPDEELDAPLSMHLRNFASQRELNRLMEIYGVSTYEDAVRCAVSAALRGSKKNP